MVGKHELDGISRLFWMLSKNEHAETAFISLYLVCRARWLHSDYTEAADFRAQQMFLRLWDNRKKIDHVRDPKLLREIVFGEDDFFYRASTNKKNKERSRRKHQIEIGDLNGVVRKLSPLHRSIFILRKFIRADYEEISRHFEISSEYAFQCHREMISAVTEHVNLTWEDDNRGRVLVFLSLSHGIQDISSLDFIARTIDVASL